MSDPFRLRVLKNLTALLEAIPVTMVDNNGDPVVSMAGRVFRGREHFGDDDPLPMISILEPPLAIERVPNQPDNPKVNGEWDLMLQGWVVDDKDHPCDPAYVLVAHVMQALGQHRKNARTRGNTNYLNQGLAVEELRIGAPVVRPADYPSANACFYLLLTLKIVEDMTNPFG